MEKSRAAFETLVDLGFVAEKRYSASGIPNYRSTVHGRELFWDLQEAPRRGVVPYFIDNQPYSPRLGGCVQLGERRRWSPVDRLARYSAVGALVSPVANVGIGVSGVTGSILPAAVTVTLVSLTQAPLLANAPRHIREVKKFNAKQIERSNEIETLKQSLSGDPGREYQSRDQGRSVGPELSRKTELPPRSTVDPSNRQPPPEKSGLGLGF